MMDAWWRGKEVEWPDLVKVSYKAKREKKAAVTENMEKEVFGGGSMRGGSRGGGRGGGSGGGREGRR
jgi:hypothetical protein